MISLEQIRAAVAQPLQSGSSDYDLNPSVLAALPTGRKLRPSAVLIGLVPRETGLNVVLTRRAAGMKHHPGQVAFPGGKVDAIDKNPAAAALREAEEEIGLPRTDVQLIGSIDSHETVTGFAVTPFIGLIPANFHPTLETGEVDEAFEVPLAFLMNTANFCVHSRVWNGVNRRYLAIPYGPHYIWGATARMIQGLADRVVL